ncbi:unnamed protein product [Pieris brassicae]|uniref:Uncharacterized protein n=1 Tax=Pieris brassicae TaxID=7116 RepID=A0A9P0TCK5_PIEBR|nr:unnamed protein product [Pieris brassicae]
MEDKTYISNDELSLKLFKLRFKYDWLFKKKKQAWSEFYKILLENGFPKDMPVSYIRKKWTYTYDCYKIAKRDNNTSWKYYKMFDKHFGKKVILDPKYQSWNDEWRLKLIICITETKQMNFDNFTMWRTVEQAMRSQDMPSACCVQDMKGLWHHLKMTFNRKHRLKLKKQKCDWALYDCMLDYFKTSEPEYLVRLETLPAREVLKTLYRKGHTKVNDENEDSNFHWTKDITESLIQIRLQNDWIFKESKWAWSKMRNVLVEENGFPTSLRARDLRKKWSSLFFDYQKAKATENKSWLYYTLFELYLGEGNLSLNPLSGWEEEWVKNFIKIRIDLDYLFVSEKNYYCEGWRKVEQQLRAMGLPLDHSLLGLPQMWDHLTKIFKWKRKFFIKGMLTEQWPYFDLMHQFTDAQEQKQRNDIDDDNHDYDDDMKLIDIKKLIKPKYEVLEPNHCRSCSNDEACVSLFDHRDDDGVDLATKLRLIGGVEIEPSDSLPYNICLTCLQELETAYKFRRKCQEVDKELRDKNKHNQNSVKIELNIDKDLAQDENDNFDNMETDMDFEVPIEDISNKVKAKPVKVKKILVRKKYPKYDYWKVCEICGKNTRNLATHLESHSTDRIYSCTICQRTFKFKSGLSLHKATHEPPKKTCEVCGKKFHIAAQYRRHFQYHANERKFECETCGKRFNSSDILRVHARSHTDERPNACPECGKTFRTGGCVSRHRRIVHHIRKKPQEQINS